MIKSKKYLIALTLTIGTTLISPHVFARSNFNRLAGQDRYGTSNAIVSQGWTQSKYAILVNSQNFPDAITASPLAKQYNAPILLTDSNNLTDITKQKLQGLGVKNVFIIGGTGVVSSDIENTLKSMGISSKRIWGQTRYDTSINVAKELGSSKGVFIVNGEHYEDALAVAPIADKLQYPIVLVSQDSVPDIVKNYVNQVKANNGEVIVIGGSDVLTDTIKNTLNPIKVYNQSSKYDRNLALINDYKEQLDLSQVYIASDKGFADALSGSALAGMSGNPIILVGDSNLSNVSSFISNNKVGTVNALGGTGVLSDYFVNVVTGNTTATDSTSSGAYKTLINSGAYKTFINSDGGESNELICYSLLPTDKSGNYDLLMVSSLGFSGYSNRFFNSNSDKVKFIEELNNNSTESLAVPSFNSYKIDVLRNESGVMKKIANAGLYTSVAIHEDLSIYMNVKTGEIRYFKTFNSNRNDDKLGTGHDTSFLDILNNTKYTEFSSYETDETTYYKNDIVISKDSYDNEMAALKNEYKNFKITYIPYGE